MSLFLWVHGVGVALALGIFAATYYSYHSLVHGSYLPLVVGAGSFFLLMSALIYLTTFSQTPSRRIAKAAGIALAETIVFVYLLVVLILNTLGS